MLAEIIIDSDGSIRFYNEHGQIHRSDGGPAIEYGNEYGNGDKYWYLNGKRHRLDGPAIIHNDGGYNSWWIDGVKIIEQEFNKRVGKLC